MNESRIKPTVKQLTNQLEDKQKTIDQMAADLLLMAQKLDADKKAIRLPTDISVSQYNAVIDYLIENKPAAEFPKDTPAKIVPMGEGGQA